MVLNSCKFRICTLFLLFYWGLTWVPAQTQNGWKSLPMRASLNRSSSHLFNRWGDPMSSNPRYGSPSVEMELAAILRDIAYGNKDEEPTSTSITPSTTSSTSPPPSVDPSTLSPSTTRSYKPYISSTPTEKATHYYTYTPSTPLATSTHAQRRPIEEKPQHYPENDSVWGNKIQEKGETVDESTLSKAPEVFTPKYPEVYSPESTEANSANDNYSWVNSLGVTWQIHVYISAGFFSLIVFLTLYCLTRVYFSTQLLPRGYYMTINLLVFLASFFRCVYFFHDPYEVSNLLPISLSNILFHTGPPLVVTGLGILILAVLKVSRLVILPFKLQSPLLVTLVGGTIIAASLAVDILSELYGKKMMTLGFQGVIQALFSGWQAALCIGFIVVFMRIEKTAERQEQEIARYTFSRMNSDSLALPSTLPKSTLRISGRLTLISCVLGLVLAGLQIYGLIHSRMVVYTPPLEPWAWFAYQTFCRILEIVMWATVSVASSLPVHFREKEKGSVVNDSQLLNAFSCKNCLRFSGFCKCCLFKNKPDDMYSTICQSSHVARNFSIHSNGKMLPHNIITSTDVSSNHINTSLIPIQKSHTLGKPISHQAIPTSTNFLWGNSHSNSKTLNSSVRPSSLVFTEEGLIKLCSDSQYNESIDIKQLTDELNEKTEYLKRPLQGIYDNCNQSVEDNYINGDALTPEVISNVEERIESQKSTNYNENESPTGDFSENYENNLLYRGSKKTSKHGYSQLHESFKNEKSLSPTDNFDTHFGEDDFYQSSAVSSTESSGHIYASIHQPSDSSGDSSNLLIRPDISKNKVYKNHSNEAICHVSTPKRKSPKKKQHSEVKRDNKRDLVSNTSSMTFNLPPESNEIGGYFMPNNGPLYTHNMNGFNEEYHYYPSQVDGVPQKFVMYKNYIDPTCVNYASPRPDNNSSPKSPSQKIKIMSNSKIPTFADVRYSPLSRNDNTVERNDNLRQCERKHSFRDKGSVPSLHNDTFRPIIAAPRRSPQ